MQITSLTDRSLHRAACAARIGLRETSPLNHETPRGERWRKRYRNPEDRCQEAENHPHPESPEWAGEFYSQLLYLSANCFIAILRRTSFGQYHQALGPGAHARDTTDSFFQFLRVAGRGHLRKRKKSYAKPVAAAVAA